MVDLLAPRTQLLYVNQSIVVSSAAISRRTKGREAKSRIHDCRSSQPRPSVTKASLLQRGVLGTQMQPHSARRACTNHRAAMTKAAKAFSSAPGGCYPCVLRLIPVK